MLCVSMLTRVKSAHVLKSPIPQSRQRFSLSCVLCLFRQAQASNDASLLYHELFSLYVHIPRRCSPCMQSIIVVCLPPVLVPSILPSKTVRTCPSQFFCFCRMVFITLLFSQRFIVYIIRQGGVILSLLSVCLSVCHTVSRITYELVYGRRPNMVDIGKGWPSRSD